MHLHPELAAAVPHRIAVARVVRRVDAVAVLLQRDGVASEERAVEFDRERGGRQRAAGQRRAGVGLRAAVRRVVASAPSIISTTPTVRSGHGAISDLPGEPKLTDEAIYKVRGARGAEAVADLLLRARVYAAFRRGGGGPFAGNRTLGLPLFKTGGSNCHPVESRPPESITNHRRTVHHRDGPSDKRGQHPIGSRWVDQESPWRYLC